MRHNLSLGDTMAGLHTALGVVMAILHRERTPGARGQVIDMALYEAVFNLMEAVVPEYDGAGVVREPSGSTVTGIVPTNTYQCADGKYIVIGANGDSLFRRLCETMGRPDMASDQRYANNAGRVEHEPVIDEAITEWTGSVSSTEALQKLEESRVPAGPIYSVVDMFNDPHYRARGLFEQVEVNGESLKIPAILPKLTDTPGRTDWPGPEVGAFNHEIYHDWLGMAEDELAVLAERGII
jgi:crotonobetainyl-CoA:carnitine CoA-transferase CaiB-like acyl-CoA transferase